MVIRMYKDVAKLALLSWAYLRDSGVDVNNVVNFARKDGNLRTFKSDDECRQLRDIATSLAGEGFQYEFNLNQLIEELAEQIQKAESPNADGRLIDEIVRILKFPFVRNRLSREQINGLKRAILMPDEVAVINNELRPLEMMCADCGAALHSGEMVTLMLQEGRNPDRYVFCVRCQPPEIMPCQNCREVHPLSKGMQQSISKGPKCEPQAQPQPNQAPRPAAPPPINLDDVRRLERIREAEAFRHREEMAGRRNVVRVRPVRARNPFINIAEEARRLDAQNQADIQQAPPPPDILVDEGPFGDRDE